jgi:hypothetical protein
VSGPYETEAAARADVRHITSQPPVAGAWQAGSHRLLCEALEAAGVGLGAHDHRIAGWLAGFEPSTVAVIAGWVTRASGRPALDSESWTCAGCGGQMIGGRPPGDRCRGCG